MQPLDADLPHECEAGAERGEGEKVWGTVFEPFGAGFEFVSALTHPVALDRAAGKPGTFETFQRIVPDDEGADARWVPEHLIERDDHKRRHTGPQRKRVCGHECGRIEQHITVARPGERMLHT